MLLYRKDEIVEKAAESNQLPMGERTPVQFVQDYYNDDWHIKAGTLAYIKVGTVLTTITESDRKESVECRIIAELAAGKDTIEIPAIAFDDGTLLVKGAKREPSPCSEVFAPPSDGDLHTMRAYEEVNAKIEKEANVCDSRFVNLAMITGLIALPTCGAFIFSGSEPTAFIITVIMCSVVLFLLPALCKAESCRLKKQKKDLEDELLRRDEENVKVYEKGDPNGRSSF